MSHVHKANLDYILSMMMLINSKRQMDHHLQFPYHLDTGTLSHIIIVCNDKKGPNFQKLFDDVCCGRNKNMKLCRVTYFLSARSYKVI